MRRSIAAVLSLLSVVNLTAQDIDSNIAATRDDQIRDKFTEGVELSRIGRFDEAALAFQDALNLDPSNQIVFDFMQAVGDAKVLHLMERAELSPIMRDILRRARIYQKEMRQDPTYINLLMDKLGEGEMVRLVASRELVASGPIVIPHLIARLGDTRQDAFRIYARIVLD